jgi:hypothetical protein
MNEEELKADKQVTEYVVHDLNLEPDLPLRQIPHPLHPET